MVETYAVEASLVWKTNVPEVLRQMMSGFEEVNRAIAGLKDNLKELSTGGRSIASIARQLDKLKLPTAALDGIREMSTLTRSLADTQGILAREAMETARAWKEMAEASRKVRMPGAGSGTPGSRSGHGGSHVSAVDAAMGAQMAGDAGMGLAYKAFDAYADVQMQQTMAQADKLVTDTVIGRANNLIATLQKQYPALTQSEGLTLFRNTMGIFSDPDESLQALPGAVRLQMLYQLAPLGRGGTGGSEVQAAEKAGDALQAFVDPKTGKLDKDLYGQWMDLQARSYQAGGGLMDAKGWLAFARTSRAAGIGLNTHALEEMQALLEMSPGRTGTALMSAFQVFGASTSHMTKKNRAAWNDAKLLDKSGDIKDRALYQTDPFEWVWKDMLPALAKKGVQTRDQVLRWLTDHGQRSTVAGLLADIAIGQTPIARTADKMERQDPNLVDKLGNTDIGKLAALHAAEKNFYVALGKFGEGPGLTVLTNLTNALNKMTEWASAHPETASRLIATGLGLALISKVVGDAAMAAIFVGGPLVGGIRALSGALVPFGASGQAAGALAGLSARADGGSLFGLAGGILAVAGAMAALPPLMRWLTDPADPNNQFHGNGQGGGRGGAWEKGRPPETDLEKWWHGFASGPSAAPGANSRGGSAAAATSTPSANILPIVVHGTIHNYIDGKRTNSNTFTLGSGVQGGMTAHDPSMSLYPQGLPAGGGH